MKELVEYLARSLADHPDQVRVDERESEDQLVLELKLDNEDLGKIIGKNGNTINAIRTVLQAAASSHKKRAKLDVVS